jgi:hypothetical protein
MQTMLLQAHSGIRYLVLLAGVVGLVYFVAALARGGRFDRTGRILTAIFTGVLDLQLILGALLLAVFEIYAQNIGLEDSPLGEAAEVLRVYTKAISDKVKK